jgi:nucleotide-binding universal stress UspA family protein
VCSGGKDYIAKAVEVTGGIARSVGASVTLLHVLPAPPPFYSGWLSREDSELLNSSAALGKNLKRITESLTSMGVAARIRLRHGEIIGELLSEMRDGDYDMVVAGTTPRRGAVRTYVMGDVTREIINHAECPVLVVRTSEGLNVPAVLTRFLGAFSQRFKTSSVPR